jgi:hypothetical protein
MCSSLRGKVNKCQKETQSCFLFHYLWSEYIFGQLCSFFCYRSSVQLSQFLHNANNSGKQGKVSESDYKVYSEKNTFSIGWKWSQVGLEESISLWDVCTYWDCPWEILSPRSSLQGWGRKCGMWHNFPFYERTPCLIDFVLSSRVWMLGEWVTEL